jgi:gliding motility-associated-like protein
MLGCDSAAVLQATLHYSYFFQDTIWHCEDGLYETIYIYQESQYGCDSTEIYHQLTVPEINRASSNMAIENTDIPIPDGKTVIYGNCEKSNDIKWYLDNLFFGNDETLNITFDEPGTYELLLICDNDFNCPDTTSVVMNVFYDLQVFVPNAFTPNGDGTNDFFLPSIFGDFSPDGFEMLIFNRWGEQIFSSKTIDIGWDGSYKGKLVQEGVYIWKIRISRLSSAEVKEFKGHVTILK